MPVRDITSSRLYVPHVCMTSDIARGMSLCCHTCAKVFCQQSKTHLHQRSIVNPCKMCQYSCLWRSKAPLLQSLHQSAMADALIVVMLLQALAVAGILLLLMTKNLAPSNVLGFCVAASNAFGLIAGIFLMGYGLVAIPRELWRTADTKNYRKMLFHRAGVQAEKAISAHA